MSRYWSSLVHGLTPYVPGEQPKMEGIVKLNTNENPYPPSPRVAEAVARELASLRLYPDPTGAGLRAALARHHGVTADQVFVGNGSDEVLAHAFLGLLKHEQPLLFPDITYSFYPVYCGLYGIAFETIALDQRFQVNVADYDRPCGGIILPNPNAPTGIALPLEGIETLLRAHPGAVVVVDEAYVDFGADSAVALVQRHPNLLVVQTFSKSRSLAGLRVGYAIGQRPLIEALERVKDSFNSYPLDRLALAGAAAAVEDEDWFRDTCARIIASRARLGEALAGLGFEVLPSAANFLFARHPHHAGVDLARALRDRAIVVRHFAKPRIADHLRITIGTEGECERLVAALTDILKS